MIVSALSRAFTQRASGVWQASYSSHIFRIVAPASGGSSRVSRSMAASSEAALTPGAVCAMARNVAVEGFAQIVNQTHQHHPLHVQFGPLAGQHGGQQRQPPRVFGGAFVPSFRGVGGAQYVFQPLGFADEAQVSDQFFHDRLRFGFQR